jgi:methionine-gamma-lyase
METLQVRVDRQISSARLILDHIQETPGTPVSGINKIYSAWEQDLEGSGDIQSAEIAKEQQANGGAMFAMELPGGRQAAFAFLDALNHIQLAVSLGSTESLAEHPASMTHAGVSVEEKLKHGITEGLVRISIGLEHPEDLIADIDQALQAACKVYEETLECV